MAEWWSRAKNSCSHVIFIGFQVLPFLKIFVTDFSGSMKARKLKIRINRDNDWIYSVYWKKGQGSIPFGVMSLGRFSKK